jgi:hypothetical protein
LKRLKLLVEVVLMAAIGALVPAFAGSMELSLLLAILTLVIAGGLLIWVAVIRRELFDPRVYVLYGIVHWVSVGQFATLLGFTFTDIADLFIFSETIHFKLSLSIFVAVIAFLLGYHIYPKLPHHLRKHDHGTSQVQLSKLALITVLMGIIGTCALISCTKSPEGKSVELWLPITSLILPGSILAAYVLIAKINQFPAFSRWVLILVLGSIIFFSVSTINLNLAYPAYAIIYWYINRKGPVRRVPPRTIFLLGVALVLGLFWALFIKEFQVQESVRPQLAGEPFSLERLLSPETYSLVFRDITVLDPFNPDAYICMLLAIETYPEQGHYLYGRTLLPLIPVLRFVWPEQIRGFGRTLVIDVFGPSATWGPAISPVVELTANFGYVAVPLFYLLLGVACRYLYQRYLQTKNERYFAIYGVVLPWLFMQQRGDFLNGNLYALYMVFIVFAAFLIAKPSTNSRACYPVCRLWHRLCRTFGRCYDMWKMRG